MNNHLDSRSIPLTVVTYRDIFQKISKDKGWSNEYQQRSAIIHMSPHDINTLGINDSARVTLTSATDKVVVQVKRDSSCPKGYGWMPVSPYSSKLAEYDPAKRRLPNLKRMEVLAEPSDQDVTLLSDLLEF